MAYDLALGSTNDLLFGASRDLLGVSGIALYEQRIRTRLKIDRGSWVYDDRNTLGSRLNNALGTITQQTISEITMYVHEALDTMDDVKITKVSVEPDPENDTSVLIIVGYQPALAPEAAPFAQGDESIQEAVIQFQL